MALRPVPPVTRKLSSLLGPLCNVQGSSREGRRQGELNYVSRVLWPVVAGCRPAAAKNEIASIAVHPSSVSGGDRLCAAGDADERRE